MSLEITLKLSLINLLIISLSIGFLQLIRIVIIISINFKNIK
jgi:hypothetical protein